MTNRTVNNNWQNKVSAFIGKVFNILKGLIRFFWEIIEHCMSAIAFFFSLLVKVLANPTTPCITAIIFFCFVMAIAGAQWWAMGVWYFKLIGLSGGFGGFTAGVVGMLVGLGINIFQNSPELWKLRRDIAEAYIELRVNTEMDTSEVTLTAKSNNWESFDHAGLKQGRLISYGLETALVIGYIGLARNFSFLPIVQAAVSLLAPEKALGLVSSTVNLLGQVSEKVADSSEPVTGKPGTGRTGAGTPGSERKQGF